MATNLNSDGTLRQYSDTVRIEKHYIDELWTVYTLTPVIDGIHPVLSTPTTLTEVWVIDSSGTFEEADARASVLAGE